MCDDRILKEMLAEQKKTNDLLISLECFLDGIYDFINKNTQENQTKKDSPIKIKTRK